MAVRRRAGFCVLLGVLVSLVVAPGLGPIVRADTPLGSAITYQGQLKQGGNPVTGTCDLQLALYDAAAGGVQVGTTQNALNVPVSNGLFTVSVDFGASAFNGSARFLDLAVRCPAGGGVYTPLTPRQPLTAAPYALFAQNAATGTVQFNPPAAQTSNAAGFAPSVWLRPTTTISGTSTAEFKVGNDGGLLAAGTYQVGTIPATGAGTRLMWHPAKAAFRAGTVPAGGASTIWDEANIGDYSFAAGNIVRASNYGAFAFGDQVTVSSTVGVGFGSATTVSGTAGFAAGASGVCDGFACVALGYTTRAMGQGSTAIGYRTGAFGDYSVALGYRAADVAGCDNAVPGAASCTYTGLSKADGHKGSFVWADNSTDNSLGSLADNQFSARAAGGFRLRTRSDLGTGCNLPAGSGTWDCTSDRDTKENFQALDGETVLAKLAAVPVTTWNYIAEGVSVRRAGPMAQDFFAAFGLGTDDKNIGVNDLNGVNLRAIQALEARTRDLDSLRADHAAQTAELDALRAENERQRAQVAALESQLQTQQAQLGTFESRLAALEARSGAAAPPPAAVPAAGGEAGGAQVRGFQTAPAVGALLGLLAALALLLAPRRRRGGR